MEIGALIAVVIWIVILGLVFWLLWYLASQIPEPFSRVARILIIVVAVLILIYLLMSILPPLPHLAPLTR